MILLIMVYKKNIKNSKMKIYFYSLIVVATMLFVSCEEESTEVSNKTEMTEEEKFFSEFLTAKKGDGSVLIQSAVSMETQDLRKNIRVSEQKSRVPNKENDTKIRFVGLDNNKIFGKNKAVEETINLDNDFFGKELSYYVETKGQKTFKSSVYIPNLITVNFSGDKIKAGTKITWNVDPNNRNGVAVILKYDPINQNNVGLAFNHPETLIKSFVLPDNQSSYLVKASDLERFPANAYVSVSVLRAAGIPPKNGGASYVSAVTSAFSNLQIIR
ncbi:hypothetical protein AWE51_11835 [Aquimarina aggregata]|uniref:Uncharacterized protein n=2 Tax=Aquimarina aggregata TaxID=1642818 RepID=A0A162YMQ5_9FLAO|nr:hypothetical protein AWE51_11835 [Aquimarina aggregata]